MITEQDLAEFKQITLEEYGVVISNEKAVEELTALVNMVQSITQPQGNSLISKDAVDLNIQKEQS